jgi:hypothetical protein
MPAKKLLAMTLQPLLAGVISPSDGKVRFGNQFEPEPNANRTPGSGSGSADA